MKILLVDDSSTVLRIQKNVLGREFPDAEILEAKDGLLAKKVIENTSDINYILLDYNMPNMNGEELLKWIRSNKEYNKIRIIMVTTEAEKKTVVRLMKMGVNGYVAKPFTPDLLRESIMRIIR